ncbi:MAG: acetylase [Burkholderia sp.]|nr:acetylase [Burkholderia sp.]
MASTLRSNTAYFPYIDGLRAVAVLAVIIYHLKASWLPGGFTGVDIFFVISGFIVSASVGSLEKSSFASFMLFFYARRIQRIAPALLVCLASTALLTALIVPSAWLSDNIPRTGLFAYFGLSNLLLAKSSNDYFSPVAEFNPYTHTWSLGVEEQFYFIFPLLFFGWLASGSWRRRTFWIFASMAILSFVHAIWLSRTSPVLAFYLITSRFWELGAGVLLYQFMVNRGHNFSRSSASTMRSHWIGAAASLLLIGYGFAMADPRGVPFPGAIAPVLGTLGILGFLHGQAADGYLMKALTSRPMVYIGKISYSLYLWHWPVFTLFRWTVGLELPAYRAAAVLLAFTCAVASYTLVEKPVRHLSMLRSAPRFAVVAAGLALVASFFWITTIINNAQPAISVSKVTRNAEDWYPYGRNQSAAMPGCVVSTHKTSINKEYFLTYQRENCGQAAAAPRIFAIGDSHALGYSPMYMQYVLETGAPVFFYRNGGCAFLNMGVSEPTEHCRENSEAAIEDMLARLRPGDVVFLPSLRLPRFSGQENPNGAEDVEQKIFGSEAVKARNAASAEAGQILQRLSGTGARVVLEAPKPIFRSTIYMCAETYSWSNPVCKGGTSMPRDLLQHLRSPVVAAFRKLQDTVPNVGIWDPFPLLCPPADQCSAFQNGRPTFFDTDHLSGYGNRMLFTSFRDFVTGAVGTGAPHGTPGVRD